MTKLDLVKEFRRAFSLPISDVPCVPSAQQLELQCHLIWSEAQEVSECESVTDILDVIVDLQYFILGLAAESGITEEQISDWFQKVHAANMRKLWTTAQVVEKFGPIGAFNRNHLTDEGSWLIEASDHNQWVVRLNGKVQKPPGWQAAQLEGGAV